MHRQADWDLSSALFVPGVIVALLDVLALLVKRPLPEQMPRQKGMHYYVSALKNIFAELHQRRKEPMRFLLVARTRIRNAYLVALVTALLAGSWANAQFPGMPQPKHYPWSDKSLSPDVRADMVIKEMTLDEKISLLHGQGLAFFTAGPAESNGGARFTKSISRLGIPAIQMADSHTE